MSVTPWDDTWRRLWSTPWWLWPGGRLAAVAQETFAQSVLPGWNFGTVVNVTEENSAAPETEVAILQKQSYGRQLGQIADALQVLIDEREQAEGKPNKSLDKFSQMKKEIDGIKTEAIEVRAARLCKDLTALKEDDTAAYDRLRDELLETLRK